MQKRVKKLPYFKHIVSRSTLPVSKSGNNHEEFQLMYRLEVRKVIVQGEYRAPLRGELQVLAPRKDRSNDRIYRELEPFVFLAVEVYQQEAAVFLVRGRSMSVLHGRFPQSVIGDKLFCNRYLRKGNAESEVCSSQEQRPRGLEEVLEARTNVIWPVDNGIKKPKILAFQCSSLMLCPDLTSTSRLTRSLPYPTAYYY